jgi:hypothetical protein
MSTVMRRPGWWLLIALTASGAVLAQTPAVEEQHRRGMALRAQGQNAEAAEVFRGIYARTREPRALARQGLAEAAAEQWVAADEHLRAALGFATDAWINSNRQALARDLGVIEGHLGTLELVSPVRGAELRVNDVVRGTTPLAAPLRVLAGAARVELRAEGYASLTREVMVTAGVTAPQRVELQPQRVVAPVVAVTPLARAAPDPVVARTPPPVGHIAPAPLPRSNPLRTLGITGLALGGVGLTLGVVGLVLRNGAVDEFNTPDRSGHNCYRDGSDNVVTPAGITVYCAGLGSTGSAMQTLSVVGFVAGGAFAAAGAVLLVTAPSASSREGLALRCGVGPGDVGVACVGRF